MQFYVRLILSGALCLAPLAGAAQQEPTDGAAQFTAAKPDEAKPAALPDAPDALLPAAGQNQQPAPASTPAAEGSSSSQAQAGPGTEEKSQREKADEQIKEQEQQRIVGIVPSFNVSYRSDAVALSGGQKIRLAFRSAIDPVTFAGAFLIAGYHELSDDDTGFGWGAEGYFKRSGAAYLDSFNGTMIGNGILPAVLHQDPRYFRLGYGSTTHRILYAAATSVICKGDKSRKWQPNVSNVGGNIIAGAISNLYYPSSNSGWGQTISNGMIVTAEGTIGGIFNEFWPDISRRFLHKDPTGGRDAQARAADAARKQARKDQKNPGKNSPAATSPDQTPQNQAEPK